MFKFRLFLTLILTLATAPAFAVQKIVRGHEAFYIQGSVIYHVDDIDHPDPHFIKNSWGTDDLVLWGDRIAVHQMDEIRLIEEIDHDYYLAQLGTGVVKVMADRFYLYALVKQGFWWPTYRAAVFSGQVGEWSPKLGSFDIGRLCGLDDEPGTCGINFPVPDRDHRESSMYDLGFDSVYDLEMVNGEVAVVFRNGERHIPTPLELQRALGNATLEASEIPERWEDPEAQKEQEKRRKGAQKRTRPISGRSVPRTMPHRGTIFKPLPHEHGLDFNHELMDGMP